MIWVEEICSVKLLLDVIILQETGQLLHMLQKNIEIFRK